MVRIIVAGSRDYSDYGYLASSVDKAIACGGYTDVTIVSGTASGADKLDERYAAERGYAVERYPANWRKYGKAAGPKRNKEMAENADVLIAFWDGGQSWYVEYD